MPQRSEELGALFKISSILGQPGSFESKLNGVIDELTRISDLFGVRFSVPDYQEGGLRSIARGSAWRSLPEPEIQRAQGLGLAAFASGQPEVVNGYQSHPNADPVPIAAGVRSVMSLPNKTNEEIIAVATVTSKETNHFNPERVRLLTAIVDGLGPLLESVRLDAQLLQRSEKLESLFNISSILGQPGTYQDKLHGVMQELARVAEAVWVTLRVSGSQISGLKLSLVSYTGEEGESFSAPDLQQDSSPFVLEAMASNKPLVINDYQAHPDAEPWAIAEGLKSLISLPIKGTQETLGVASIVSREVDHFNPERVRLLTAIADGLGPLLESARLHQDLIDSIGQLSEALDTLKSTQERVVRQERLHALGTMASGIAHDFNNALSPILGYSEFLLEDTDRFDESAVKYLQEIRTSAQDAGAVVSRLR